QSLTLFAQSQRAPKDGGTVRTTEARRTRSLGGEEPPFSPRLRALRASVVRSAGDRARVRSQPLAVVLGDPVFDRPQPRAPGTQRLASGRAGEERRLLLGDSPPAALPGTAAEAHAIARLHGCRPLLREGATEAGLR